MATSQFIIYTSSDPNGPGPLTGQTGSLITVLDAVLVNGYTGKPGAGWTKPLTNLSYSVGSVGSVGCYKQGTGSMFTLFVNDAGGNITSLGKESWACGFEQIVGLTGSSGGGQIFTASYGNGTGYGQFPTAVQLLTYGHVVWRKSFSLDATPRPWIIVADSSSMYMWTQPGESSAAGVPQYAHYAFGDIYSLYGSSDLWRCMIYGKTTENTFLTASSNDYGDCLSCGPVTTTVNSNTTAFPGHYLARTAGGLGGGSTPFTKKGDSSLGGTAINIAGYPFSYPIGGNLQTPNFADNSLYLSPVWVMEPNGPAIRGRLRGMYQVCHPYSNFNDGQTIQGSGDYAGKTFMFIRTGFSNASVWTIEISPTVETN